MSLFCSCCVSKPLSTHDVVVLHESATPAPFLHEDGKSTEPRFGDLDSAASDCHPRVVLKDVSNVPLGIGLAREHPLEDSAMRCSADSPEEANAENEDDAAMQLHVAPPGCVAERFGDLSIQQLSVATDAPRIWIRECLAQWRDLPVGDECEGSGFIKAAAPMTTVYPWVFCNAFAVKYLSKDFQYHCRVAQEKWPKGATSLRQAVQMERKAMGVEALEKAYWNTCTVNLLWLQRALMIFVLIFQDFCNTSTTPVQAAKHAVETVLAPYLSWALSRLGVYIVSMCVTNNRNAVYEEISVPEAELKQHLSLLVGSLQPHVLALGQMLDEEVPSVVRKKL